MNTTDIIRFIHDAAVADFDRVASSLLRRQLASIEPRPAAWQGETEKLHQGWQTVPPVPTAELAEVRTSPCEDELRRAVQRAVWRTLAPPPGFPVLILTTADDETDEYGLANAAKQSVAAEDLTHPVGRGTFDSLAVRSWLAARQRAGKPATIVTSIPLAEHLAAFLERRRLIFRLPSGSRLIGQGHAEALEGPTLGTLASSLGLATEASQLLVDLPSLTTPLRVGDAGDGAGTLQDGPHWIRYRRQQGRLVVTDLATTLQPAIQQTELAVTSADESGSGLLRLG